MKESLLKQGYYKIHEQDISMSESFKSVLDQTFKYVVKQANHFVRNIAEFDSS